MEAVYDRRTLRASQEWGICQGLGALRAWRFEKTLWAPSLRYAATSSSQFYFRQPFSGNYPFSSMVTRAFKLLPVFAKIKPLGTSAWNSKRTPRPPSSMLVLEYIEWKYLRKKGHEAYRRSQGNIQHWDWGSGGRLSCTSYASDWSGFIFAKTGNGMTLLTPLVSVRVL